METNVVCGNEIQVVDKKKRDKLEAVNQKLLEIGKKPPQAIDLEEAVLGALMLDNQAITKVMDILKPASFYKEQHHRIYKAITGLFRKGTVIDILTVTQELKNSEELEKIGGAYYISTLTNRVASSANIEFHARIIQQKYMQRELIRLSTKTIEQCYHDTDDVFDILDSAQTYLNDITAENIKKMEQDATVAMGEFIHHLEAMIQHKSEFTGVPCTIRKINEITSGWQKSDLIIVGGRPGAGKSAFVKSCIKGCIDSGEPVAVFSLEMSTMQIIARLVSEDVGVSAQALMMGKFAHLTDFANINLAINKYYSKDGNSLLFIDDSAVMSINEFKAKSKRLHSEYGIKLIVVDYLQLLKGSSDGNGENRVGEIGEISRGLKALAKELNIPVIALSQLSRAVETNNPDHRPKLSHLRESGCLTGDTLVTLANGEKRKIEDIVNEGKGVDVLTMGFDYKIAKSRAINFFNNGTKDIYELILYSGHKIKSSINHKYYCLVDGQEEWLELGDIILRIRDVHILCSVAGRLGHVRIDSITHIGRETVYDLTIEETHNFIANDIIVHNSIEQDADVVLFLYRPDYYVKQGMEKFREIQYKGQMISSEGFAEAIIAKHRNGVVGTVAMRFVDHLTKFQDWDDVSAIPVSTFPEATSRKKEESGERNFQTPPDNISNHHMPNNTDFLNGNNNGDLEKPPF